MRPTWTERLSTICIHSLDTENAWPRTKFSTIALTIPRVQEQWKVSGHSSSPEARLLGQDTTLNIGWETTIETGRTCNGLLLERWTSICLVFLWLDQIPVVSMRVNQSQIQLNKESYAPDGFNSLLSIHLLDNTTTRQQETATVVQQMSHISWEGQQQIQLNTRIWPRLPSLRDSAMLDTCTLAYSESVKKEEVAMIQWCITTLTMTFISKLTIPSTLSLLEMHSKLRQYWSPTQQNYGPISQMATGYQWEITQVLSAPTATPPQVRGSRSILVQRALESTLTWDQGIWFHIKLVATKHVEPQQTSKPKANYPWLSTQMLKDTLKVAFS